MTNFISSYLPWLKSKNCRGISELKLGDLLKELSWELLGVNSGDLHKNKNKSYP